MIDPPTPPLGEGSKVCENFKRIVGVVWGGGSLLPAPPPSTRQALAKHSSSTRQAPLKPYPPPPELILDGKISKCTKNMEFWGFDPTIRKLSMRSTIW